MTFYQARLTKPMVNSHPANQRTPPVAPAVPPLPSCEWLGMFSSDMVPSNDVNPATLQVPLQEPLTFYQPPVPQSWGER